MKLETLSCRRRVALLLDYLDRELPGPERKLLARHRAACRSCASLLTTLERTVRTLRALKRASKPPASARRALAASLRNID
ncbi:MAG: anti-sigma factor [Elusimicrobia bacterium]|nr:anti-sigma factor [Elusimicrobiota bacterium]